VAMRNWEQGRGRTVGVRRGVRPARVLLLLISLLVSVAALFAGSAAGDVVTNERPLLFTFDGSGSAAGRFEAEAAGPYSIAVDNASGDVYVGTGKANVGQHGAYVSRFDAEGEPVDFPATGSSSLFDSLDGQFSSELGVAVDNSIGPSQGRLYVSEYDNNLLSAFQPDGTGMWSVSPSEVQAEDVGVDDAGHPWLAGFSALRLIQYEESTSAPSPTGCSIPVFGASTVDLDANGNAYVTGSGSAVKYMKTGACEYTESTLDPEASDVYPDQSSPTGHIFTAQTGDFEEYDSSGTLVGTFGGAYLGSEGERIAYNPSRDWVYVIQRFEAGPVVAVFGPAESGAVPDVTEIEEPVGIGVSTAHFEGTVNPRGVASSAHFEWKRPGESWAAAKSSPSLALAANETPQTVAFDTNALRGATTYELRLATVNAGADRLRAFSIEVKEFTTDEATTAPAVTIGGPTGITTEGATVEGTVDPEGDTADWRMQLSTDPACTEGFADQPARSIEESSDVPVDVSFDFTGLLPSQHYCARLSAQNSAGTTLSDAVEFETASVVPGEVEIMAAAPREDTSARLNARVNPRGAPLTYRFEYSVDEGATWVSLESREESSESREKIVIAQELTGLQPASTYRFRLGLLEGPGGPAGSLGGEAILRTRATEPDPSACSNADIRAAQHVEYLHYCRGLELINNPDKGAQNALLGTVALSGEAAFWIIPGGAPGSPSGTRSTFRASRTPGGWHSSPIAPPAAEQIGGGTWNYLIEATTPDLSTIVAAPTNRNTEESALVRLGADRRQELLHHFSKTELREPFNGGDATTDAAHVLFIDPETTPPQIEEMGEGEPGEVVSVMPDGAQSECGMSIGNEGDNFTGPSNGGRGAGRSWRPGYHRIATTDASRLFFQVQPNGECGAPRLALYQRDRESGETTLIDSGTPFSESHFIRATPDGRVGYFGTASSLDPTDGNSHEDVYRWDEETGEATCLTCEVAVDADLEAKGPILVSDDFSHVYFASRKALSPAAIVGNSNVYSLSSGVLHFVASLPPEESSNVGLRTPGTQLSADGRVLTFPSFGTRTLTADQTGGEIELYRYDDADGSLECVSCRREGPTSAQLGKGTAVSADGSTVAFETTEALVPGDVNDAVDVYEWREGRISLITDGVSERAKPNLAAVSADGTNVFFSVVSPGLTGFERDGVRNDYDARIGGGFEIPTPPTRCFEDSCQGPLLPAPPVEVPGSSSFGGGGRGNPSKPRCRKGKVRRHGRCVARHPRKHKHHRRRHAAGKGGNS
jgi:hypothetical protein